MDNSTKTQPLYFQTKIPPYLKNGSLLFLFALLAIDFVFMGLHTLKSLGYLYNPELSVTKNFGYAETFQYLKAGFIASWFFLLAWRHKRPLFYCWAAIFSYILLDDSLEVHEYLGFMLSDFVTRNFEIGLGGTFGELVVFGLFGLLLFVPLGWYFYKSKNRNLKIVSQDLFILFTGMMFFGMGIDVLHDFAPTGNILNGFLGLMEDGGEMIMMSMIVWYTWTFMKQDAYFYQERNYTEQNVKSALPKAGLRQPVPLPATAKKKG